MPSRQLIARLFLVGGGLTILLGLILWFALPVKLAFPPYFLTALLAIAYGLFCLRKPKA